MRIFRLSILLTLFCVSIFPNLANDTDLAEIKPGSQNALNIISYNMWGLPMWLPKVGINNRFDKACNKLDDEQADIICLQECFSKRLRKKLITKISAQYYGTLDYSCNNNIAPAVKRDCHGGLMTLTKLPIISEEFYEYPILDKMKKTEKLGHKGFIVTTVVNQMNDTLNIINTHLYAGPSFDDEFFRMKQILFMHETLQELNLYKHTCILAGDMNVDHPEVAERKQKDPSIVYNYITNQMSFRDSAPQLTELSYTIDRSRNFYSNGDQGKQKLDYIFIRYPENIQETWELEKAGTDFAHQESYSDHLAWQVRYNYN